MRFLQEKEPESEFAVQGLERDLPPLQEWGREVSSSAVGTEGALPAAVLERYQIPQGTEDGFGKEGEREVDPSVLCSEKQVCFLPYLHLCNGKKQTEIPQPRLHACGSC